eukprot:s708_g9.t1
MWRCKIARPDLRRLLLLLLLHLLLSLLHLLLLILRHPLTEKLILWLLHDAAAGVDASDADRLRQVARRLFQVSFVPQNGFLPKEDTLALLRMKAMNAPGIQGYWMPPCCSEHPLKGAWAAMWQTLPFALFLALALLPTATADGTGTFTVVPPQVASLRGRSIPISEDGGRLLETADAVEPMDKNHVVSHFFRDVEAVNSQKGRPMRLQVVSASLTILIYAMIVRRSLQSRPGSRSVIFVPKDVCCDPTADVTVCLTNRADFLLGQHFHIKLVDCADRLQLPGDVTADMSAEFSTCFSGIEVDHDYTLTCAVSGRTALPGSSLQCFLRPLTKVASHWAGVVRLMRTSCAGSPTVLVFTRVERARQCAEQLCAAGIRASSLSAADGTSSRRPPTNL